MKYHVSLPEVAFLLVLSTVTVYFVHWQRFTRDDCLVLGTIVSVVLVLWRAVRNGKPSP